MSASPKQARLFAELESSIPTLKKLALLFAIIILIAGVQESYAQNIEGQIVASQYGNWQVPLTTNNSYSFSPTTCRVQGGASYFFAFAVGTPIKIVDGQPSLNEFVTPTAVIDTNDTCAISVAPVNNHQSPSYITSGTGGLQEALNQNLTSPATNTVILSNQWYQLVGAANAQAIIAAAKGGTQLGLVDVTTVPTTFYSWNGSQYVAVANGGASSPATNLVLKGSGGSNGIIAATPGTDYVIPSGSILGTAAGTVPNTTAVLKGTGTVGVSTAATPGTDYVIPSGSITGSSGTAGALTGTPTLCPAGQAPIGVLPNGNATGCAPIGGGGGVTGGPFNVAKYSSTAGSPSGPSPSLFAIDTTTTLSQLNALVASLNCGNCTAPLGGSATVLIPDGVKQLPFTNQTAGFPSANPGVDIADLRTGVRSTPFSQFGVACYARNSGSYVMTSGSTSVTGGPFVAADLGSTIAVTGTSGGLPTRFMPTITAYVNSSTVTISTPAPFSGTFSGEIGILNTSSMNSAMTGLVAGDLVGQFPSGCGILTDTVAWTGASMVGDAEANSVVIGVPGDDIFQTVDATSVQGSVSHAGIRLANVSMILDSTIDASKPWQAIDASGNTVAKAAIYRPTAALTANANNPLAPGWALNATNGVANTTQNSAVICVPTALGRMPVVGQQIIFRDFASVFQSTISSLSGSCSTGFSPATMANALPNTTGYTKTQAEWVSTSAVQSLAVAISAGSISYPYTITVATSTAPTPGYPSNVATHGRVKIGPYEADYLGGSQTSPYTLILRSGPATVTSLAIGTPVVPENPCYVDYEVPWPVTPTVNTNDATPSGATYFPGMCVGNAAISMPQANAKTFIGSGLADGLMENVLLVANGNNINNTAGYYVGGNMASYGTTYRNFATQGLTYSIVQGPASANQHYISAVGPSGDGNHYYDLHLDSAYGLILDQLENSTIQRVDGTSVLSNPYDGTVIGTGTSLILAPTYDEQVGGTVSIVSLTQIQNFNMEPAGSGTGAEVPAYAYLGCFTCTYDDDHFEGIPTYIAGASQLFNGGQLGVPSYNYGSNNVIHYTVGASSNNLTAGSQTASIINWGTEFTASMPVGSGQAGPNLWGANNVRSSSDGQNQEFAYFGNFTAPPVDTRGGMIYYDEFVNNNPSIESNPMTLGPTYDPTALVTGGYIGCALGGGASCNTTHFNGLNQIFIGPQNRIPADKTLLSMMIKASTTAPVTVGISALSNGGSCAGAVLLSQSLTATSSWTPFEFPVDFTGQTGCTLGITITGSSAAKFEWQYFDFLPLPSRMLLRPTTYTSGQACTATGISGIDSTNMYVCVNGTIHVVALNAAAGTQTVCSVSITLSGSLTTATQGSVGSGTCTGLTPSTDTVSCSTGTNIFTVAPFTPSTSGTPTLALQVATNTITFNAENNLASTQSFSGPTYFCKAYR